MKINFLFITLLLIGQDLLGQNFADIKKKDSEKFESFVINANSSSSFYTVNGSLKFDQIDSIIFFYQPSNSLLDIMKKFEIVVSFNSLSDSEKEKLTERIERSIDEWIVNWDGDTLRGYMEMRENSIGYKSRDMPDVTKIKFKEIKSYKKGDDQYDNIDGMKLLEKAGKVSIYSEIVRINTYSVAAGANNIPMAKTKYYLKREHETLLTSLSDGFMFKTTMREYFNDCPEVLKHLKGTKNRRQKIFAVVDEYNKNCP